MIEKVDRFVHADLCGQPGNSHGASYILGASIKSSGLFRGLSFGHHDGGAITAFRSSGRTRAIFTERNVLLRAPAYQDQAASPHQWCYE